MNQNKEQLRSHLREFDFQTLFLEGLGWDYFHSSIEVPVDGKTYPLKGVAQKRGLAVFVLTLSPDLPFPDYPTRRKIETKLAKSIHEHLIIFIDEYHGIQIWQWVKREPGKPASCREYSYHQGQSGEALIQKLEAIAFTLEEEERLTLPEVTGRTRIAFDVERVTKRFYDRFQKEHARFFKFIKGITDQADHEWYASVMLNRLMFVYFIQRKGFLDGEPDYLRNRLNRMRTEYGEDKFYTFYRYFLLRLFHEGLGGRTRTPELEKLIGRIPYLDGGIFDIHELERPERYGKDIQIPDEAFEHIFDFFDQYQWHLDERPLRADNEINPDVLGYIFEKYINQKQMGAYYTKEDITGYISKNTVIPFLLDAARTKCKVAFEKSGSAASAENPTIWDLLKSDPDRYIYKAVRHGVTWNYQSGHPGKGEALDKPYELPEEIAIGLNPVTLHHPVREVSSVNDLETIRLRKNWNKAAPSQYALPTETWRELINRRKRYEEIKAKLAAGEVHEVNDLITYNLDIRQFAQDLIENCEGPDLLRAIWQALEKISILDPTCGSGAFLFAALNILEPLYEACLCRMEAFVEDLERSGEKHRPEKFSDFRKLLSKVAAHPNRPYFIFKSIILNNLYGVDIMEEAVEICKLRLFLKLAAQVDPDPSKSNLGIEPLPDIDFNIRAGNTLVGYAHYEDVLKSAEEDWVRQAEIEKVKVAAADLQQTFDAFRSRQVEGDGSVPHEHKQELRRRLGSLNDELNRYLAGEYGINKDNIPNKKKYQDAYANWLKSHQPFHWFIEFYGIVQGRDGFDVIIGNPPYVEYKTVTNRYTIRNFISEVCGNLYVFVVEKSFNLTSNRGKIGLILPISITAAQRMVPLQDLIISGSNFLLLSNFGLRPAALFPGIMQRLSILISSKGNSGPVYTTDYITWYAEEREVLFLQLNYFSVEKLRQPYSIPKANNFLAYSTLAKILIKIRPWSHHNQFKGNHLIFYHNAGGYWIKTFDFKPYYHSIKDPKKKHTTISEINFPTSDLADTYLCILNSSLFYFFWKSLTDARHVYPSDIAMLPIELPLKKADIESLRIIVAELMGAFKKNRKKIIYGDAEVDQFYVSPSKQTLDEIDCVLARHYSFTEEELDFIINYDIKYRMGKEIEEGGE